MDGVAGGGGRKEEVTELKRMKTQALFIGIQQLVQCYM